VPKVRNNAQTQPRIAGHWVAVLGRRDTPTDGIEDYCLHLSQALKKDGVSIELLRVPWADQGWIRSLRRLKKRLAENDATIALVQYTALGWSRWGFSVGVLLVVRILKRQGLRVVVVFHDVKPFSGIRVRDRIRHRVQVWVMQRLLHSSAQSVLALSPSRLDWVRPESLRDRFNLIPIGSNVPECSRKCYRSTTDTPTIAVFTVTEGRKDEVLGLGQIAKQTAQQVGILRLIVMGRGALEAQTDLRDSLKGTKVELMVHGILRSEQVSEVLSHSDLLLYIRAGISPRRSSVIAGICSGLPVAGWADDETTFPVTEAGIRTAPFGDIERLVREIAEILTNDTLRASLRERSRSAAERLFKWDAIAERYCLALYQERPAGRGDA
jgi:glycosyltransferase involved in cell wall biosynthesis